MTRVVGGLRFRQEVVLGRTAPFVHCGILAMLPASMMKPAWQRVGTAILMRVTISVTRPATLIRQRRVGTVDTLYPGYSEPRVQSTE